MKGMILAHAIDLLECITHHSDLIRQRTRTMACEDLPLPGRVLAGRKLIALIKERREYHEELEEILDQYFTDCLTSELYDLPRI